MTIIVIIEESNKLKNNICKTEYNGEKTTFKINLT